MCTSITRRFLFVISSVLLLTNTALAGHLDLQLTRIANDPTMAKRQSRTGLTSVHGPAGAEMVSVIMEAATAALPGIQALGVNVRTVLSNGITTADVPVTQLWALAARDDVGRIEAAKRVRQYNDLSNSLYDDGAGITAGMNNGRFLDGTDVVVGVVDSGLDWTHGDFINDATGASRIAYYWDQSDRDDDVLPSGSGWSFSYGHEYTAADFNAALTGWVPQLGSSDQRLGADRRSQLPDQSRRSR